MEAARVSVIVPMRNAARYILETLESVYCQSYTNWELIIVDDGSTDSSGEKVDEFIAKYPTSAVRLLHHPQKLNRGTSASRNLGMHHAAGVFLCFLDADDVWQPDFLDFFVTILEKNPEVTMAYGPALLWHTDPDGAADQVQQLGVETNRLVAPLGLFAGFLTGEADTPSPSGVMMRRDAILGVGGWEEAFRGMYDDQVLYSKLLLQEGGVYVAGHCLYRYRQHPESICKLAAKEKRNAASRKKYLEWLHQYLVQKGQLSEEFEIIIVEQMWYVHRQEEIESVAATGWWHQRIGALNSLMNLLRNQKSFIAAVKLGRRIVWQQAGLVARTIKSSGH